ncbi:AraC family transcriptional regulator, partial [Bacteroides ovatus]
MLDIIYYFNIFGCLTMGMALLLIQTAPQLINPHYRNAKRFLGIASII